MKYIKIKPFDTLFFNTGRPFSMGEDTWVNSLKFPNPSVVWGALFSHLIAEEIIEKPKPDFSKSEYQEYQKQLEIGRILLYNSKQHLKLLPVPRDLFVFDKKTYTETYIKTQGIISNVNTDWLTVPDTLKQAEAFENVFFSLYSIEPYMQKINGDISIYEIDELAETDSKVGIMRDINTRTSRDKHLYRIDLTQFLENWSFLVEYETKNGIDFNETGVLKLGGESKTAAYKKFKNVWFPESKKDVENGDFFKLYFTSPAFFELSQKENETGDITALFSEPYQFYSAAIGKLQNIGGWDMVARKPKPLRKAIPAGSVILLQNKGEKQQRETIKKQLNNKFDAEQTKFGYNQFEVLPLNY